MAFDAAGQPYGGAANRTQVTGENKSARRESAQCRESTQGSAAAHLALAAPSPSGFPSSQQSGCRDHLHWTNPSTETPNVVSTLADRLPRSPRDVDLGHARWALFLTKAD